MTVCARRSSRWSVFGRGFDSPRLHQHASRRTPQGVRLWCIMLSQDRLTGFWCKTCRPSFLYAMIVLHQPQKEKQQKNMGANLNLPFPWQNSHIKKVSCVLHRTPFWKAQQYTGGRLPEKICVISAIAFTPASPLQGLWACLIGLFCRNTYNVLRLFFPVH